MAWAAECGVPVWVEATPAVWVVAADPRQAEAASAAHTADGCWRGGSCAAILLARPFTDSGHTPVAEFWIQRYVEACARGASAQPADDTDPGAWRVYAYRMIMPA